MACAWGHSGNLESTYMCYMTMLDAGIIQEMGPDIAGHVSVMSLEVLPSLRYPVQVLLDLHPIDI